MPYVSTLRSPTRGSQSSGRMDRPRARRPGHGTERSKGEPVPRLLLSSCLCPKPAFSPEGPQLKIKTYQHGLPIRFKSLESPATKG